VRAWRAVGFAGAPAYVAAKHGIVGLTRNAALRASFMNGAYVPIDGGYLSR
jgi:hypothetical protein